MLVALGGGGWPFSGFMQEHKAPAASPEAPPAADTGSTSGAAGAGPDGCLGAGPDGAGAGDSSADGGTEYHTVVPDDDLSDVGSAVRKRGCRAGTGGKWGSRAERGKQFFREAVDSEVRKQLANAAAAAAFLKFGDVWGTPAAPGHEPPPPPPPPPAAASSSGNPWANWRPPVWSEWPPASGRWWRQDAATGWWDEVAGEDGGP